MQWLYNLIHGLFSGMFAFFGKTWWLIKNSITFQIAVVTSIFSVAVILWRMFYHGINLIIASLVEMQTLLSGITSVDTIGDLLDIGNFIFPIEESFAMLSILIAYGVACLTIRVIRAFIPTMT